LNDTSHNNASESSLSKPATWDWVGKLAILIAMIGIVKTLMLSKFERTHEIGLLRAVGR
jgi:hypothetical protein